MDINYKAELPEELMISAKSLEHLGISEMAWDRENAIKVIEFLYSNNYAILGGDVYKEEDGDLNATYDSWYFNRSEAKSAQDFLQESSKRAIMYINRYHARNGEGYYYSIICNSIR